MQTDNPRSARFTTETVTCVHYWTDALFSFRTTRPQGYRFLPGQYSRLGLRIGEHDIWRAYSIVSAPDDDFLEYYSIVVPQGAFTTSLKQVVPGTSIMLDRQVFGFMTPDRFEDGTDLWMLSTGTGLGPFISMLQDRYVWEKFQRLILVHGVRRSDEFAYRELLHTLENASLQIRADGRPAGQLQVIRTTTREPQEDVSRNNLSGRITALLENGLLEKQAGCTLAPEASRVMLCGNPDMIEDTRRILHVRGMRPCRRALPGQFVTENYW